MNIDDIKRMVRSAYVEGYMDADGDCERATTHDEYPYEQHYNMSEAKQAVESTIQQDLTNTQYAENCGTTPTILEVEINLGPLPEPIDWPDAINDWPVDYPTDQQVFDEAIQAVDIMRNQELRTD